MSEMLSATGIRVAYGKIEAVRGIDLAIAAGQIVTVIGPNGAGKSSLLNALAGILPHGGEVRYGGVSMAGRTLEDRVAAGLCLVPETRALFGRMSVDENLILGGFARRRDGAAAAEAAREAVRDLFPRLRERAAQMADTLSGGERQMLALGRALLARPKLLLLDEPSLGLAPRITREIFVKLRDLRAGGVSILLVEQNARAALQIADYGYVVEGGRVVSARLGRGASARPAYRRDLPRHGRDGRSSDAARLMTLLEDERLNSAGSQRHA